MRWGEFEQAQPRFAAVGHEKLGGPGVVFVGTIRKDGSPRISPVEPFFWEGDLWLTMLLDSMKARDLKRDPRILIHSIVTQPDGGFSEGEYKVRGRALEETDAGLQTRIAEAIAERLPWRPEPGKFHLFRIDVDDVTFIRWEGDNNQYMTRWPEGREQVRRGTSATSVGPPEPHSEYLD
jgi:Pyridoxamine 5'-phosphate oxidase